jgi:hypothetical protein
MHFRNLRRVRLVPGGIFTDQLWREPTFDFSKDLLTACEGQLGFLHGIKSIGVFRYRLASDLMKEMAID